MGWTVSPKNLYVEVLAPIISECHFIWVAADVIS